jgi:hypothetical protein
MPVTTWVPVFLFVILFGLSMDYEVFLLSKIREEYDRLGDNSLAVGRGLAATARVISAAAAIMVVVFLSFVLTPDVSVKQIGLGLAAAALVDATVVRLVLVPAGDGTARAGQLVAAFLAGAPAACWAAGRAGGLSQRERARGRSGRSPLREEPAAARTGMVRGSGRFAVYSRRERHGGRC